MATIRPNSFIESISGSICRHDSSYFATNRQTGKTYGVKRCFENTTPPSASQIEHRAAFGAKSRLVAQWYAANKPTVENPDGTEAFQLVKSAYKAQHKVGNIRAFISTKMDAQGNLTISVTPINNGNPSGGGNYEGGGNEGL